MQLKIASPRNTRIALTAVTVLALVSIFASTASAGNGNGRGHKKHRGGHDSSCDVRYVRYRQPERVYVRQQPRHVAYAQPAYVACAPRYISYRPNRVVIVRPAPYVRVGGRFGSVDISAIFGSRRQYSSYDYGCNFCSAHYTSYSSYETHVQRCEYRPANVRIQCRNWDNAGYNDYRESCSNDRGRYSDRDYGDRYNDGYDDRGYDDRDDDGYYGDDD